MPGICRGYDFPPIQFHINSNLILMIFLAFNYLYGTYLISKCTLTFTCINLGPSPMFQFHQNNSQLLFHVIVSSWGAGAFRRVFTKILARQCRAYCRAFSRALKIEKLKALLFPGPGGAGDANDWCIKLKPKSFNLLSPPDTAVLD